MKQINIFSIAWSDETFEAASESGYKILDNRKNERPDWYELWPIRKYIIENGLVKDQYYGFFSSKFQAKTKLSAAEVYDFVESGICNNAAIITFSPQPDQSAGFINVFEHANFYFPGYMEIAREFMKEAEINVELDKLVMDSRTTVFSNYFVANYEFWMEWFKISEKLFNLAENPNNSLALRLNKATNYGGGAQHKVFLQEEIASLLMTIYPEKFKCFPKNLWKMGWGQMGFEKYPFEMIICDALKIAMRDTNFSEYMAAYDLIRSRVLSGKLL